MNKKIIILIVIILLVGVGGFLGDQAGAELRELNRDLWGRIRRFFGAAVVLIPGEEEKEQKTN